MEFFTWSLCNTLQRALGSPDKTLNLGDGHATGRETIIRQKVTLLFLLMYASTHLFVHLEGRAGPRRKAEGHAQRRCFQALRAWELLQSFLSIQLTKPSLSCERSPQRKLVITKHKKRPWLTRIRSHIKSVTKVRWKHLRIFSIPQSRENQVNGRKLVFLSVWRVMTCREATCQALTVIHPSFFTPHWLSDD